MFLLELKNTMEKELMQEFYFVSALLKTENSNIIAACIKFRRKYDY